MNIKISQAIVVKLNILSPCFVCYKNKSTQDYSILSEKIINNHTATIIL